MDGAKEDFTEAKKIKKVQTDDYIRELDTPEAYLKRGNHKLDQSDIEGALLDFNKAIEKDPGNCEAYLNRGAIKQAQGDTDGAAHDFRKAKELQFFKK